MNENDGFLYPFYDFFKKKNFENSRKFSGSEYTTKNLENFLISLGNPHKNYKTIHVAGTTGKGSTATYLARALNNYKTGLFVSPHLESLLERISIDGKNISKDDFLEIWNRIRHSEYIDRLSFFDALTAISMIYFNDRKVDWAVFETGLGGRMDSTNNIQPEFSVITEIGLDHMNILGNSIAQIANEKGGIIKFKTPVYANVTDETARNVLKDIARKFSARIQFFEGESNLDYRTENFLFVKWIYEDFFKKSFPKIDLFVKGRFELVNSSPKIIFDSAHNNISIQKLINLINQSSENSWYIYLNTMKERDIREILLTIHNDCKKEIRVFLFPLEDENYYQWNDLINLKLCEYLTENQLILNLKNYQVSHLITGSMRLYKKLIGLL